MSSRHRLVAQPRNNDLRGYISASLLAVAVFAAILAGSLVDTATSEGVAEAAVPPQATKPVSQEGTLIAVSAGSMTARSANGFTQTYVVTSDTLAITSGGSQPIGAAPRFAVNDEVNIVGTMQNGTALVTAVAHRDLGHGDARPMDYVDG
ncbi:MAG: hypothetical protein QOF15_4465 [Mycobacterium sp.]|jgi:hypothetical protein|nr:hypothetical protein [Mycobacterium sp.]MDT7569795.1 hypothetical protein [Pseudonocardiales bacterium]